MLYSMTAWSGCNLNKWRLLSWHNWLVWTTSVNCSTGFSSIGFSSTEWSLLLHTPQQTHNAFQSARQPQIVPSCKGYRSPSNTWFLRPTRVYHPINRAHKRSHRQTDRQTDHATTSHLANGVMRAKNQQKFTEWNIICICWWLMFTKIRLFFTMQCYACKDRQKVTMTC